MNDQEELNWLFPDPVDRERVEKNIKQAEKMRKKGHEHDGEEFEPKAKTLRVPDGTYTLVLEGDDKPHRTIRVTPWSTRPGFSVFSMLTGPDNSLDFTGFGEQEGDKAFHVWRKFSGREGWIKAARALVAVTTDPEAMEAAGLLYAAKSERCRRCYHPLSVPASLHRGYGPDCAEALGII